jgi:pimeloyl-ACP methyl ester carboxylesterase
MTLAERVLQTPGVALNYAVGPPDGRPFVLLHAGAARWQYGQTLLELLAPDFQVYTPDFRGHGKSGRVASAYSLADYTADIATFLVGVVREPAIVYGHSLGGEVAVLLAARHPQLIRALIVGDAPLSTRDHATDEPRHRAQNELWHRLAGQPAPAIDLALREMQVPLAGSTNTAPARQVMGDDGAWFAFQAETLHQLDPDMLAAVLAGPSVMLAGYDPLVLLPAIECPVLLLQADPRGPFGGGVLRDDEVQLALELLRHATHVRLQGIGHPLHGPPDQTPIVLQAIKPFLRSV